MPLAQECFLSLSPKLHPAYEPLFHCIQDKCEDTCCQGWQVAIDAATLNQYKGLAAGPLRARIEAHLTPHASGAANLKLTASNQCPMLDEGLCSIQSACGEAYLSHTCATYPRIVQTIDGIEESTLALSCPEAARLVLLAPELPLRTSAQSSGDSTDSLRGQFWALRAITLRLIKNRAYPLWQRIYMLGILCYRIEATAPALLPGLLQDFEASVQAGTMRPALDTLPADNQAQLDVVLRLAGMLLHRAYISPRFANCIGQFTAGIGNGPGATLASLAEHYTQAYDRYYEPFFDRHPQILENYLVNTMLHYQFPLGREEALAPTREFTLLVAQFALIKGLLIGVAGTHREDFALRHVIETVQAAAKHFEHHADFLTQAHTLLQEGETNNLRGLATLLRHTRPTPTQPAWLPEHAPVGIPPHLHV